jgi:pimeloyl-ACP methyl ester carboxylesterase
LCRNLNYFQRFQAPLKIAPLHYSHAPSVINIFVSSHLRSYLSSLQAVTRRGDVRIEDIASTNAANKIGHCILIHGWASDARAMRHLQRALRELPQAARWQFWDVSYDTSWTAFPDSARLIVDELQAREHDFSRTLLIGYSMGGLVARQMVAEGFPISNLVTLCTPHHGPVRWMPLPLRGSRSLARWSHFVKKLNTNPRDIEARENYHFFAVTYRDLLGAHRSDGMVSLRSALGLRLGEVASRHTMQLKYKTPISALMPFDPHWRAMFPQYIPPAIEHIGKLMEARGTRP